ncbi:hypothetical protein ACFQU7_11835 [Pseudoroseomonas wenyumeiae]
MSENLLEAAAPDAPEDVPEKFRDEAGALRVDALLKSYKELEKRMSQRFAPPAPDAPEEEKQRFRRAIGVPDRMRNTASKQSTTSAARMRRSTSGCTRQASPVPRCNWSMTWPLSGCCR